MATTAKKTVKEMGQKIKEGAENAVDFVKEKTGMNDPAKGAAAIREHMDVIASCGTKVGNVDHVEGDVIKLTKKDSPDNQHHFIPVGWVDHVDSHVHLRKNSKETELGWKSDATSCGCGT